MLSVKAREEARDCYHVSKTTTRARSCAQIDAISHYLFSSLQPFHVLNAPESHLMSSKSKKSVYSTANIDSALLAELEVVSELGVYDDLAPLVSFVHKGLLMKTLQNFGHFTSATDISKIAQTMLRLAGILEVINFILHEASPTDATATQSRAKLEFLEQRERLTEFYTEILQNHLKHFYKIFSLRKPSAINPSLRVLSALVGYNSHALFSNFTDSFDFNHSSLMKLLIPTKDDFERKLITEKSMRLHFMNLYMAVAAKSSPVLRKALLTNFKIMNNFWKYMEMDRYEVLIAVIGFIDKSVLSEPLLRRISKCQILNENFIFKFSSLFSFVKPENDRAGDEDEDEFNRFKSSFTDLMNTLVTDQEKGITFPLNEFGSPITVHNKTFKINNKLIYTLLTALRPWESYTQLQYVMTIINHNTELVPPYMNWIVSSSGGYHDPSLSAYWVGHTLLYSEILKSDSLPAKFDFISLPPLSPASLVACLSFNNDLVKQFGLQLILLTLNKLARNKASQSLIDSVLSTLPPQASYIPLLSHENDLIKFTTTAIVKSYEQLAPSSSSSAVVSAVKENLAKLDLDNCSNRDLVLLDNYLSIQSNNDLKWWSKLPKGNSFFTSLLKLSNIEFLKPKTLAILSKLTSTSIVFNLSNLIDSPLYALIEACSTIINSSSADKLWNCLDETISRAVKTPYKYLDKSHLEYSDLSIFFVVLFEQFKFIPNYEKEKDLLAWLAKFVTDSVVLGESLEAVQNLSKSSGIPLTLNLKLIKPKENLTKKFDFAQQLYVFNRDVNNGVGDSKVFDHVSKLGNFLISLGSTDKALVEFISNPDHWFFGKVFTSATITETQTLAISLLAELFKQMEVDFSSTSLNTFFFDAANKQLPPSSQKLLSKFLWAFTDEQLTDLAAKVENEYLVVEVLKAIDERKINFSPDLVSLDKLGHPEIKSVLVQFQPSASQLEAIIEDPQLHYLLDKTNDALISHILTKDNVDDELLYRLSSTSRAVIEKHQTRATELALSMKNWAWSIKIFALSPESFDLANVSELLLTGFENDTKVGFSNDFVKAVDAIARTNYSSIKSYQERFNVWFHKCMLYITKKFAESKELSNSFNGFLVSMESLLEVLENPWRMCPGSILNAQLEVFLGHAQWVNSEDCSRYANKLVFSSNSKGVAGDKLLQIYLNNQLLPLKKLPQEGDAALRFQSGLLIHKLFNVQSSKTSLNLLNQLIMLYLGSTRAEDLLLKDTLKVVESKINKSWVDQVTSWDFLEQLTQNEVELVGEERLIIKDKNTMVVALKKAFVMNSIAAPMRSVDVPVLQKYGDYVNLYDNCLKAPYKQTEYDPEFLLLVILNNDELVSEKEGIVTFSIRRLIESLIFQVIVLNLAHDKTREVSKILLHGMCKFIQNQENSYKDKTILLVYLSSILHTLRVADHQTPLVWNIIGSLAEVIINPGHFLYDRVCRYILTNPIFKAYEIPLYYGIANGSSNDDLEEDTYYKQVAWMIEQLIAGTKNGEDLNALRLKGVVEWALNLSNVDYVTGHLRHKLFHLIYQIQSIGGEGGDMLVTKFAGLSSMEAAKLVVPQTFSGEQLALNIDQIGARFGLLSQTKRLREWTSEDVGRAVKRIHSST